MSVSTGNPIQLSELVALATVANAALSPATAYDFASGGTNYLTEFNRIRSDLLVAIFTDDTSALYLSRDALTGGLQCVGINPNWTPDGDYWQGKLCLASATTPLAGAWLPLFKNIQFVFASADEDFSGNSPITFIGNNQYLTGTDEEVRMLWGVRVLELRSGPVKSFTWVQIASPSNITRTEDAWGTESGTSPNIVCSHTFSYDAPVAGNLIITIKIPLAAGGFEEHTINEWVEAGTGTIDFTATGDYALQADVTTPAFEPPADYPAVLVSAELFWNAATSRSDQAIIHPTSGGIAVAATDIDIADFNFTLDLRYGCPWLGVNVPAITGLWLANTLPVPAVNGYLDTQFAPYVQKVSPSNWPSDVPGLGRSAGQPTACAGNAREIFGGLNLLNPRTSLSQAAPLIDYPLPSNPYSVAALASGHSIAGSLVFPYWLYSPWDAYGAGDGFGVPDFVSCSDPVDFYVATTRITSPSDPAAIPIGTASSLTAAAVVTAIGTAVTKFYWLAYNSGADIPMFAHVDSSYTDVADRIRPVEPAIGPQPVRWPVLNITADYPFFSAMDPYRTIVEKGSYNLAPGQPSGDLLYFPEGVYNFWHDLKYSNNTGLPIYVRGGGPPTVPGGPYDFFKADGIVTLADLRSHGIADNQFVYLTTYNNTGGTSSGSITYRTENNNPAGDYNSKPVLIPFQSFNNATPGMADVVQALSFNILDEDGATWSPKPVPRCGQVIYSLLVRRNSVETIPATPRSPSKYLPPASLPALTVSIGQYRGLRHSAFETIVADSYVELTSVTIPEGEVETRVAVFWPVVYGACLIYSASEAVNIEPLVCWQPMFHGRQYAAAPTPSSEGGRVAGADPSAWYPAAAGKYTNYLDITQAYWNATEWHSGFCQFPMAADVYNSHLDAINLL